ncbi:uncharacterized, partial [Tachysurus ichikawai]
KQNEAPAVSKRGSTVSMVCFDNIRSRSQQGDENKKRSAAPWSLMANCLEQVSAQNVTHSVKSPNTQILCRENYGLSARRLSSRRTDC